MNFYELQQKAEALMASANPNQGFYEFSDGDGNPLSKEDFEEAEEGFEFVGHSFCGDGHGYKSEANADCDYFFIVENGEVVLKHEDMWSDTYYSWFAQ